MTDAEPIPRRAYLLLALGSLGYAAFTFVWFVLPAFLPPVVADLGLSSTGAGVINGAIPLTYVPLALASGLVVDRVGPGRSIGAGLGVIGAAGALRSSADGFPSLLLLTVAVGVGGTGITFGLPKLVSVVVPEGRTGTATSVYIVGASAGTAAAFSVGRPLLGPALGGWRPVFLWSGLAVLGFAAVWSVAVRWLASRTGEAGDGTDDGVDPGSVREDLRAVFSHRGLRLLVVVGTVYLLVMHGTQAWLATILEDRGLSAGLAAGLTTLLVVARTAGVVAIPPISDALDVRRSVVVACGVLVALGVGGLVLTASSPWLSAAAVVVCGLGLGGLSPMIRTLPIELPGIGPRLTGTATGLVFAVGEIGGFLGPFLLGTLYDLTGSYEIGLSVLAATGLLVVAAGIAMPEVGAGPREDTPRGSE